MRNERAFLVAGLHAAAAVLSPAQRPFALRAALSLVDEGIPSVDELIPFIGRNWVVARRSPRIVAKYGDAVRCLTSVGLDIAYERALYARASVSAKNQED